jgi:cation diffusion facilitator CzcD-associated flavoprotein CzcO
MSAATAALDPRSNPRRSLEVIVIGAGLGGVAAAIELRRHGITSVTILERAPDLGGTWFYNSYPGAACDVPSHLYSYSYAKRRARSTTTSARSHAPTRSTG